LFEERRCRNFLAIRIGSVRFQMTVSFSNSHSLSAVFEGFMPLENPRFHNTSVPYASRCNARRFWCSRVLRLGSAVARLLGLWVRIPRGHGCLSVVSVVCCQVEISATGLSLVYRSLTECVSVKARGEFRPRQTRQLPRALHLKGRLLSCQSY